MMTMNASRIRLVVAGATGYLGRHLVEVLANSGHEVVAIVRPGKSLPIEGVEYFEAQVTQPETLRGVCDGASAVFSALGITRQTDAVTYEDIEYTANMHLLREATSSGVGRFGVISAIHPEHFQGLAIMESRERFIAALRDSEMPASVVRATGFFCDLQEVFEMAAKGRVYLLGDGTTRTNPVHGEDLAQACAEALLRSPESGDLEMEVGGPDVLSWNEIARAALRAAQQPHKVTHVPLWLPHLLLPLVRPFHRRSYDVGQFMVRGASIDMVASPSGDHHLRDFYGELALPPQTVAKDHEPPQQTHQSTRSPS